MTKIKKAILVRKHARWAKKQGKCVQCQHPWHDGMCSCDKWGQEEKTIAEMVYEDLGKEMEAAGKKFDKQQERDMKRINARLKPAKELEKVWQ